MKDSLNDGGGSQVLKIIRTAVIAGALVAAFFISYFVVKIILKSRNVYFSTLRILGASQRVSKNLLVFELFIVSNLAYFAVIVMIFLQFKNVISFNFINEILEYLKFKDYIILYIILMTMSYLISTRYAKKIFKKSTMKTYNEEV